MRGLWPIEKAAVEAAIEDNPASEESLREQVRAARVTAFENTGSGFFSTVSLHDTAQPILIRSPLNCAYGKVDGVEDAMGFLAFLEDGRLTAIEGYCLALRSTTDIDFETVAFELRPYSAGNA